MPHCILEYSNNIIEKPNHHNVLAQINQSLYQTGLFDLNDIKSRVIIHEQFVIGDGDSDRGFVTLSIEILNGRDNATKKMISEKCLGLLEQVFNESFKNLKFSITVQIKEIDKPSYTRLKSY